MSTRDELYDFYMTVLGKGISIPDSMCNKMIELAMEEQDLYRSECIIFMARFFKDKGHEAEKNKLINKALELQIQAHNKVTLNYWLDRNYMVSCLIGAGLQSEAISILKKLINDLIGNLKIHGLNTLAGTDAVPEEVVESIVRNIDEILDSYRKRELLELLIELVNRDKSFFDDRANKLWWLGELHARLGNRELSEESYRKSIKYELVDSKSLLKIKEIAEEACSLLRIIGKD